MIPKITNNIEKDGILVNIDYVINCSKERFKFYSSKIFIINYKLINFYYLNLFIVTDYLFDPVFAFSKHIELIIG